MIIPSRVRHRRGHGFSPRFAGVLTAFAALEHWGNRPRSKKTPTAASRRGGRRRRPEAEGSRPGDHAARTSRSRRIGARHEEAKHLRDQGTLPPQRGVPYDRLTAKSGATRIKPIPLARGVRLPLSFGIQELGPGGRWGQLEAMSASDVKKVEYFEEIALVESNAALLGFKPNGNVSGPDGLTVPRCNCSRPSADVGRGTATTITPASRASARGGAGTTSTSR